MNHLLLRDLEFEILDYSGSVNLVPCASTPRRSAEQTSDEGDKDVVPAGELKEDRPSVVSSHFPNG